MRSKEITYHNVKAKNFHSLVHKWYKLYFHLHERGKFGSNFRNFDQCVILTTFFATFLLPKKMKGTKNLSSLTVYSQNASAAFSNFCVRLPAIKLEIPRYRFIKICLIFLALKSSFFLNLLRDTYSNMYYVFRFKILKCKPYKKEFV